MRLSTEKKTKKTTHCKSRAFFLEGKGADYKNNVLKQGKHVLKNFLFISKWVEKRADYGFFQEN